MKKITQSALILSMTFIAVSSFAGKSFAAQSCGEAVVLEARMDADDDTGADPDLMTEECMADGSSVKLIGQNTYSVLVDCGDMPEMLYDVTVKQDGDMCRGVDSKQDKTYNPTSATQ